MKTLPLIFALIPLAPISLYGEIDFTRDVQPILNSKCVSCHGGVKEAGGVSFIFRDQVLGKGESGKAVVVPGKPGESELIARIVTDDEDDLMPRPDHGPRLSPADVETLRQWISEGAEWGEHWAFVAPKRHDEPSVKNSDWAQNDIDKFILAKLESKGLSPSPKASPSEWLRRASFDLTGLPPSAEELDAFEAAAKKNFTKAVEQETERLLASPGFGERWASVWMDLARYADSEGLGVDKKRDVWKYRDWLINAFNRDLPYDQFTIDQLAGDLVPDSTLEQKVATVFSRLTQSNGEGGTDDEEFRVQAVMDRATTTWETWQGISFGCVQCHSHPYDPIKHEEYYNFLSFFNNTKDSDAGNHSPVIPVPYEVGKYPEANDLLTKIREVEEEIFSAWSEVDQSSEWFPVDQLEASSEKAEMSVVMEEGYAEFRATDNALPSAVYHLLAQKPDGLDKVSAVRLTYLPKNLEKALTDAEWGGQLSNITVHKISPDGTRQNLEFAIAVADEAHPLNDPNGSIKKGGSGWGTYYKFFRPRFVTFVLKESLALGEGDQFEIILANGGKYNSSFPLVAKRGRLALTDDESWIETFRGKEFWERSGELRAASAALRKIPSVKIPIMEERDPAHARVTTFFNRGSWLDKGDVIPFSDTPHVFPPLNAVSAKPSRLDLAKWIASPENPLTARVAVNRFWLELFGVGIVPTPEDFGSAGEKPTHPELLDTLAVQFSTEMNWSVKTLLRKYVTSAAYQQASAVSPGLYEMDADNRLLARGPRQRLTGEMARDAALAVSGLLTDKIGGAPVYPPLPPGVWTPFDKQKWETPAEGDPQRYRRAIYTFWKRSIPYPTFITFDAPSRELCSKRRMPSNTPVQALAVMNDPAFQECTEAFARRMKYQTDGAIEDKISRAYRLSTSRMITRDRLEELKNLFDDLEAQYEADPTLMKNIAGTPDGAAFTVLASVLLNLDEAITR
ncbi:PSD1 and planctomycete cytochrome C domain-containing protein [Luteolibacter algae]|uniref:PSD1 and planctomycete cytochrome C domain-containing protein n=1 Tax=Luteolibacter algae TaxID=454151 RepID=A0ABW5D225_9BACT